MSALKIVNQLKQAGQDFEWYPTTREIIEAMYWDIKSHNKNYFYNDGRVDNSRKLFKHEYSSISLLDIGAGNCKAYNTINEISKENYIAMENPIENGKEIYISDQERRSEQLGINKYMVIEKSQILINTMPREALVVGVDFDENNLIDKRADVVFCNPPYSEYEKWSEKIIREANADYIYLVIPQRWGSHRGIAQALKDRQAKVEIVGNFDFLNSEDRKARAKVSLVKVYLVAKKQGRYDREKKQKVDPFELWFNETFKIQAKKEQGCEWKEREAAQKAKKANIENALVLGRDLVSTLVELYENELGVLIGNYLKLSEIDAEILKELNVDIKSVLLAFKEKISGLKALYWQEIFNNLSEITRRLTSKTRASLLNHLAANTNIDFNASNVRSIVIWVIKNANHYYETQMIDMYDTFTTGEGIQLYKSNKHFNKDTWRYSKRDDKDLEKYALDYRIVLHSHSDYLDYNNISKNQIQNIKDIIVVARNLGFEIKDDLLYDARNTICIGEKYNIFMPVSKERKLKKGTKTHAGKIEEVYDIGQDGSLSQGLVQYLIDGQYYHYDSVKTDDDIFTTVKGFKNGNTHYQFNQNFMKKLNLEVGRLRGWIKSPQEAAEQFDISVEEASEFWNSNFTLLPSSVQTLLPNFNIATIEDEPEEEAILASTEDELEAVIVLKDDTALKPVNQEGYTKEILEIFATGTLF